MNDERLVPLLDRYAATRAPALRDELVESYLPLAVGYLLLTLPISLLSRAQERRVHFAT